MSGFEQDVIDRLGRIETKLDADYMVLHGNGHPGLVQKHEDLENRILILEEKTKTGKSKLNFLLGILAFLVNAAIALYAALKD